MNKREFLNILAIGAVAGLAPGCSKFGVKQSEKDFYQLNNFGQLRLFHITDTHAQLNPIYYREPDTNIGVGEAFGRPPHLVGDKLLEYFNIPSGGRLSHAFSHINYTQAAKT